MTLPFKGHFYTPSQSLEPVATKNEQACNTASILFLIRGLLVASKPLVQEYCDNLLLLRKGEIHVQFFDTPVTRAWVAESLIRGWGEKVAPGQATDAKWEQGEIILLLKCWIC